MVCGLETVDREAAINENVGGLPESDKTRQYW